MNAYDVMLHAGGALGSAAMLVSPVSRSVASAVVSETQQGTMSRMS